VFIDILGTSCDTVLALVQDILVIFDSVWIMSNKYWNYMVMNDDDVLNSGNKLMFVKCRVQ